MAGPDSQNICGRLPKKWKFPIGINIFSSWHFKIFKIFLGRTGGDLPHYYWTGGCAPLDGGTWFPKISAEDFQKNGNSKLELTISRLKEFQDFWNFFGKNWRRCTTLILEGRVCPSRRQHQIPQNICGRLPKKWKFKLGINNFST